MKIMTLFSEHSFALRPALCLSLLAVASSAQAVEVVFIATFQAPTCQVSAPPSIDFGTVESSTIKNGDSLANTQSLEVTLSQCTGFVGTTQTQKPGITVTGAGNNDSGDFLFRQATSQAENYGIRLTTSSGAVVASNSFLPTTLGSSDFDGGSTVIPLKVALSCGNKCADAATKAGALTAAITFDFAYQ